MSHVPAGPALPPVPPHAYPAPGAEPDPAGTPGADRRMVSLRLSRHARQLLKALFRQMGVSQAAVLEMLLREAAADQNHPSVKHYQ